jgi:hypothetical protein
MVSGVGKYRYDSIRASKKFGLFLIDLDQNNQVLPAVFTYVTTVNFIKIWQVFLNLNFQTKGKACQSIVS